MHFIDGVAFGNYNTVTDMVVRQIADENARDAAEGEKSISVRRRVVLRHGGHVDRWPLRASGSGRRLPQAGDGLLLGVEHDARLAVEAEVTECRGFASGPGEEWQRNRNTDVDTNLPSLALALEATGNVAVGCEDSGSVSVGVAVDNGKCLVEVLDADDCEGRSKDLLSVAAGLEVLWLQDAWADKVTLGQAIDAETAAVEDDLASVLLAGADELLDTVLRGGGDDRAKVDVGVNSVADPEALGSLEQTVLDPLASLTNGDENREGHAPLTGSAECGTGNGVQSGVLVGIWHQDGVVLGTQVRLNTLSVGPATVVDVCASAVTSDEADGLDPGVVADSVDGVVCSVNNVEDTSGCASLLCQFNEHLSCAGNALRWLDDVSVTSDKGNGD